MHRLPALLAIPQRAPRATLAVIAALTIVLGWFAAAVRFDSSADVLLPSDDPERLYYERVRAEFGSEEAVVVGLFADDVLAPPVAAAIARLSADLDAVDGVRKVVSLSTVDQVSVVDGLLRITPLMKTPPRDAGETEALRRTVAANPLFADNLMAPDSRAAAITVFLDPLGDQELLRRGVVDAIQRLAAGAATGGIETAVSGIPVLKVAAVGYMVDDTLRFLPLAAAAGAAVLLWAFGTLRGVLLPLLSVVVAVVWTIGLMSLNGTPINLGTLVLGPMLMAVGTSYAIHFMSQYYVELRQGRTPAEVVDATVRAVGIPVTLAALTTLAGFATFVFNAIPAIRDFGVYSVFGVVATFVLSLALPPALLVLLPSPRRGSHLHDSDTRLGRALRRLGDLAVEHSRAVLALSGLLCAGFGLGIFGLRVETNYFEFFKPTDPVRLATERIADGLGGAQPISIIVDGGDPQTVNRPDILADIAALQEFLAERPGVHSSLSVVDQVRMLQAALDPEATGLPPGQADVEQLLVFLEDDERRALINDERSRTTIVVRTNLSGSSAVRGFVADVQRFARENFPSRVDVRPTGTVVLLDHSADRLAWGQVTSLWQILVVLLVIMSSLFLSLRMGLLSLVPNVIPILVLFGVMGATGTELSITTSMIAAFAIGIAVDDTIHYLTAFGREMRRSGHQLQAVRDAMREMGKPMIVTTVALCAGFLVVCLSNFRPVQYFGALSSLTMAVALIADLFITPAIASATRIITLWEVLFVVVGPEPHKQIPLFRGLRPFQAKILALVARLASAPAGTVLARRGEQVAEMYVMLSGRAEVRLHDGPPLRTLTRGDVIGEMGLLRQRPRSADVVVVEEANYLVIDAAALHRIQRRHPRIAAVLLFNLTLTLSDRLENTTGQLERLEAAAGGAAPQTRLA